MFCISKSTAKVLLFSDTTKKLTYAASFTAICIYLYFNKLKFYKNKKLMQPQEKPCRYVKKVVSLLKIAKNHDSSSIYHSRKYYPNISLFFMHRATRYQPRSTTGSDRTNVEQSTRSSMCSQQVRHHLSRTL